MYQLTQQQFEVIDALSNGAALTEAAAQAGADRNTLVDWRACDDFREALAGAYYERAALYRDRAVALADLAFEAIRKVLTDPKSSPSIRLRAAIFIIDKASTPPKFEKEKPAAMAGMFAAMAETDRMHLSEEQPPEPASDAQECTTAHNDAQPNPVFHMHNSAQPETCRRSEPKTGRDGLCPCGSAKKYKHCCLAKPAAGAA